MYTTNNYLNAYYIKYLNVFKCPTFLRIKIQINNKRVISRLVDVDV